MSAREAFHALGELRRQRLLDGLCGVQSANRAAACEVVDALPMSMARALWCLELDLNPLMSNGSCFTILDARMRMERKSL